MGRGTGNNPKSGTGGSLAVWLTASLAEARRQATGDRRWRAAVGAPCAGCGMRDGDGSKAIQSNGEGPVRRSVPRGRERVVNQVKSVGRLGSRRNEIGRSLGWEPRQSRRPGSTGRLDAAGQGTQMTAQMTTGGNDTGFSRTALRGAGACASDVEAGGGKRVRRRAGMRHEMQDAGCKGRADTAAWKGLTEG
ncbi:hypothetical protein BGZ61DRAFT_477183 [Ilyonectria robusta]|uniref:uncharacterized protein n=1 Tax=Ilyonectria robusta TaxID=1079257 RepID=UPI001E8CAD20|nr:uncharacterized protein BGZ61DRAFT_477183 [Ilyonectria robusta]KAH8706549.1 hypothetical protein BGZ61DRAFT_477183 [Ilyonectria robusta]